MGISTSTIDKRIIRLPAVSDRIGMQKAQIYSMIRQGKFPAPIRISNRAVGWIESEVNDWIDSRERVGGPKPADTVAPDMPSRQTAKGAA